VPHGSHNIQVII